MYKKYLLLLMPLGIICAVSEQRCYDEAHTLSLAKQINKGEAGNVPGAYNYYGCFENGKLVEYAKYDYTKRTGVCSRGVKDLRSNFNGIININGVDKKVEELTGQEVMNLQAEGKIFAVGLFQYEPTTFKSVANGTNLKNQTMSAENQKIAWGNFWFKGGADSRGKTIWNYLTCQDDDVDKAHYALVKIWAFPVKVGTERIDGNGNGQGIYSNGCDSIYYKDKAYAGWCYEDTIRILRQTKNELIYRKCASCQKEDENATTPENSNSSPQFDYTHTDKTFQSSKRELKAQYKYENANNCYCNALCA